MIEPCNIIDISQPIRESTACFPGDTPFSQNITVSHAESQVINLSAFTMSPHVGTHADAPVHVRGEMSNVVESAESAGNLPLAPFIGPVVVVDVAPWTRAVSWEQVRPQLERYPDFPKRILIKTATHIRDTVFEPEYAWLSADLISELATRGVQLVGIDTPSVDAIDSKTLDTHHALLTSGIFWLENLNLTQVPTGQPKAYFLVATPLKFVTLEASPVRAVLLEFPQSLSEGLTNVDVGTTPEP